MTTRADEQDIAPERPAAKRGAWYWVYRVARLALVGYIAIVGFLFFAQDGIIFPGRDTQGTAAARVRPGTAELVQLQTSRGDTIYALFGGAQGRDGRPLEDAATRPTVLFFYGNASCMANSRPTFEDFRRLGLNVLMPEYVGYGMSTGKAGEEGCYETADAAYEHLLTRGDVDPSRIVVSGWSLGAAVATDVASRRPVAGLAIFSAFTSAGDMARRIYPYIPVSFLLSHKFETKEKLSRLACPVFIAHGTEDRIIPFDMSDELERASAGEVTKLPIEGADHNDLFLVGGPRLYDGFRVWAEAVVGA